MPTFGRTSALHFEDTGGEGELGAVLLLHGLGSRGVDWGNQVEALSPDYRLITLDFPGHGMSGPLSGPTSMGDLATLVVALLDDLNLEKVHVVGFSLGGMVAFQLAADAPDRLLSVTIINALPGLGAESLQMKFQLAMRLALIRLFGLKKVANQISYRLFPEPAQHQLRKLFTTSIGLVDKQSYLYLLQAIRSFDVSSALVHCRLPILVLAADQDYTPVDAKRAAVANIPHAELVVVPDSRHATPIDSAELCNSAINGFLRRLNMPNPEQ